MSLRRVIPVLLRATLVAAAVWALGWLITAVSSPAADLSPGDVPALVWLMAEAALMIALAYGLISNWEE